MRTHLLVPVDFSEPSKKLVDDLSHFRYYGSSKLTLLHVLESRFFPGDKKEERAYRRRLLEEMQGDLEAQGWQVDSRLEEGRPGSKITAVARKVDADLIALANRGHAAVSEVVLGSVAAEVLERADLPVFLYCADASNEPLWDRIVHPTDFSKPADRALKWVSELAVEAALPVLLLHAVDDRYHGTKETQKRRQRLQKRAADLRNKQVRDVEVEIIEGPPKKVVVEASQHYRGALFVMGAHGRGWLGDLMLGSVARKMARLKTHHLLFIP